MTYVYFKEIQADLDHFKNVVLREIEDLFGEQLVSLMMHTETNYYNQVYQEVVCNVRQLFFSDEWSTYTHPWNFEQMRRTNQMVRPEDRPPT